MDLAVREQELACIKADGGESPRGESPLELDRPGVKHPEVKTSGTVSSELAFYKSGVDDCDYTIALLPDTTY